MMRVKVIYTIRYLDGSIADELVYPSRWKLCIVLAVDAIRKLQPHTKIKLMLMLNFHPQSDQHDTKKPPRSSWYEYKTISFQGPSRGK